MITTLNPLDWTAEPFLMLYAVVAGATLLLIDRTRGRIGFGPPHPDLSGLDALHLAYLVGGPARALDTALVALFEAGAASYRSGTILFKRSVPVAPEYRPYLHGVGEESARASYHRGFAVRTARIGADLSRRGLVPTPEEIKRFTMGAYVVLLLPLLLGATKVLVGMSRDRPVGILCVALLLTAVMAVWLIGRPPFRTRAGTRALAALHATHARAARAPLDTEVALAFALSGGAVLMGRDYRGFLKTPGDTSGGSGCGSSGDSGGDGGGSDGGGGCGGCSG